MPLNSATRESAEVMYLGRSDPFAYDAGEFNGRPFPAGNSLTIVVGVGDVGYAEIKVKGKDFPKVWPVIDSLGRGTMIEVEYDTARVRGALPELKAIRALANAGK